MYVFPIGGHSYLLDRDERRVGKYMDIERVPAPIQVSHDVRHISITKIDSNQGIYENTSMKFNKKNEFEEEWLGKYINILI